LLSQVTWD